MNEFRETLAGDFEGFDLISAYDQDPNVLGRCFWSFMEQNTFCYTVLKDGKPIAILGFTMIYSKVADIWALVSKAAVANYLYYAKVAKQILEADIKRVKPNRVQIFVRADQTWAARWAQFLGLNLECVLSKYGEEGADYYMFARVI